MLSFLHPLEGDRPENSTFAAINADIFDTVQLNFREMSAERRQRSIMAFLRLIALLFAEVSRVMGTGATPDGHALLQLAAPAASARGVPRPTSATSATVGPSSAPALPFNVWRRSPSGRESNPAPSQREAPGAYVEVLVDDEEVHNGVAAGAPAEMDGHAPAAARAPPPVVAEDLDPPVDRDALHDNNENEGGEHVGPENGESEIALTEDPEEVMEEHHPQDESTLEHEPGRWMFLLESTDEPDRGQDDEQLSLVQSRVQAVQRFGLLKTVQRDLDAFIQAPGLAARRARLLYDMSNAERQPHPGTCTGDRADKFRALEALLVSYGARETEVSAVAPEGLGSGLCSMASASSSNLTPSSSRSAASEEKEMKEDRQWALQHWHGIRCYLLQSLFGGDDATDAAADSQLSADSVEITGEIMVQQHGMWRLATDAERDQIEQRDRVERELEVQQEEDDANMWIAMQEQKKSEAAQAWDRQALEAAMSQDPPRKRMRLGFRLRDRDGGVVAEGNTVVEALPSQVHSTETWLQEELLQGQQTEEPNVGSEEFDQLVVASSQQLPEPLEPVPPPEVLGQDSAVVAAYLALFRNGSLPEETVEDRFGSATLGVFKARRLNAGKLLDDPTSWHIFRRWQQGDLSDEDIIMEHGLDYLETLRGEQALQGGTSPLPDMTTNEEAEAGASNAAGSEGYAAATGGQVQGMASNEVARPRAPRWQSVLVAPTPKTLRTWLPEPWWTPERDGCPTTRLLMLLIFDGAADDLEGVQGGCVLRMHY